jgi:hypothetical protein
VKTELAQFDGALVVRHGSMTRVYPANAPAWWLRADGAVGHDLDGGELVRWSVPGRRGLRVIETAAPTPEMEALETAVATVGLMVARVADVPGRG